MCCSAGVGVGVFMEVACVVVVVVEMLWRLHML